MPENTPWLVINSEKKALGLLKKHRIYLKRIYIPRISIQMEELKEMNKELLKSNGDYAIFISDLKECINRDFGRRKNSNND